ncbi:MAG: hypothetical protein V9F04_16945 [Dermatophilaceae bacterium]
MTGDDAFSLNEALAVGSWQPIDPRDAGGVDNAVADPAGPEHILEDQSIAIQKGNANLTDAVNSPGDIIEYTLAVPDLRLLRLPRRRHHRHALRRPALRDRLHAHAEL